MPFHSVPFHSVTTTDSVENISGGLAKSLSEVLNPPTSSPIHVVLRQQPCACVSRPLVTAGGGRAMNRPSTRHATFGVEDGVYVSRLHLIRAVRRSHERMGQSITSIRAHGPEQCRFRACVWHLAPNRVLSLQSTCSCPPTPSPRLLRSKVSTVDSGRAPARCSIRPVRRSKLKVAVCSRADASHGLLLRHTVCRRGERF